VKLQKKANGREAMKNSSVSDWYKSSRKVVRTLNMSKSQMKEMLKTFFDIKGIVHFEFITQSVNRAYYLKLLKRLPEAVRRKRPELWPNEWILHHDNAPAHKALSVKQFLAQKSIDEMEPPPYSPDSAPNGFWLFPKIKFALKRRRFQDTEDIPQKCDGSESYSTTRVSKMFPTVATSLD
jgi:transposase